MTDLHESSVIDTPRFTLRRYRSGYRIEKLVRDPIWEWTSVGFLADGHRIRFFRTKDDATAFMITGEGREETWFA